MTESALAHPHRRSAADQPRPRAILDEEELPLRFTALTPCFRSEAGSAGRDTRGMIRQHQFNKVELVSITTPEQSLAEHERMTACAEEVLKRLGLPIRIMMLCTGDMGFALAEDLRHRGLAAGPECLSRDLVLLGLRRFPGAAHERALPRRRTAKSTRFVHTLNGSGVAVGRALIAVLENYQNADGSVTVPDALRPYMGGDRPRIETGGLTCASSSPTTTASTRRASRCCEAIARALSDDVWVVAPETDQSGVAHSLSLNDPLRLREIGDRAFRRQGHADRLRHHGRAPHPARAAARPRALRRQSRPEHRRGRHLFRHGRRRHGRRRCSASPPSRCRQAYGAGEPRRAPLGLRARTQAPGVIRKVIAEGIPPGRAGQRQLPGLRARRRCRASPSRCRAGATPGPVPHRRAAWTGAATRISGSASRASRSSPANGTDLAALAERKIVGDAAARRPDRRADADALRRRCSTSPELAGGACPSSPDHDGAEARIAFLMALRAKGLRDTDVLRAFETVPRSRFVPRRFVDLALTDVALPIACGQSTLAPSQMAEMIVALDLRPEHRVLEIGSGSGYGTAILARLAGGGGVDRALPFAGRRGAGPAGGAGRAAMPPCMHGDGGSDRLGGAPFDRILDRLRVEISPAAMLSQLTPPGGSSAWSAGAAGLLPRALQPGDGQQPATRGARPLLPAAPDERRCRRALAATAGPGPLIVVHDVVPNCAPAPEW